MPVWGAFQPSKNPLCCLEEEVAPSDGEVHGACVLPGQAGVQYGCLTCGWHCYATALGAGRKAASSQACSCKCSQVVCNITVLTWRCMHRFRTRIGKPPASSRLNQYSALLSSTGVSSTRALARDHGHTCRCSHLHSFVSLPPRKSVTKYSAPKLVPCCGRCYHCQHKAAYGTDCTLYCWAQASRAVVSVGAAQAQRRHARRCAAL